MKQKLLDSLRSVKVFHSQRNCVSLASHVSVPVDLTLSYRRKHYVVNGIQLLCYFYNKFGY